LTTWKQTLCEMNLIKRIIAWGRLKHLFRNILVIALLILFLILGLFMYFIFSVVPKKLSLSRMARLKTPKKANLMDPQLVWRRERYDSLSSKPGFVHIFLYYCLYFTRNHEWCSAAQLLPIWCSITYCTHVNRYNCSKGISVLSSFLD